MTGFKNILLGTFLLIFVLAILVFSDVIKIGGSKTQEVSANITLWGPFSDEVVSDMLIGYNSANPNIQVTYVQVPYEGLHERLVEAIASGRGPDLVIFSNENFLQDIDKLYVTPYLGFPQRTFIDTYTEGSSVFLNDTGVVLFPLVIDPMVVYYNKDLLAAAKFIYPPRTWSVLNQTVPLFLKKDKIGITQSAVALGESINMPHFKKILATLFLQSGAPVVSFNTETQRYIASLGKSRIGADPQATPQEQAFMYYQSFSDPTNPLYSWNKKLDTAQDAFVSGKTTFYLAPSSELFTLQTKNPNLNFDVTGMFQPDTATRPVTYGTIYGIGMIKNSPNLAAAVGVVKALTTKEFTDTLSKRVSLAPARRDLLLVSPASPYLTVFFDQALHTFAWADPQTLATDTLFRDMIRKSASGEWGVTQALYETKNQIQSLIQ